MLPEPISLKGEGRDAVSSITRLCPGCRRSCPGTGAEVSASAYGHKTGNGNRIGIGVGNGIGNGTWTVVPLDCTDIRIPSTACT